MFFEVKDFCVRDRQPSYISLIFREIFREIFRPTAPRQGSKMTLYFLSSGSFCQLILWSSFWFFLFYLIFSSLFIGKAEWCAEISVSHWIGQSMLLKLQSLNAGHRFIVSFCFWALVSRVDSWLLWSFEVFLSKRLLLGRKFDTSVHRLRKLSESCRKKGQVYWRRTTQLRRRNLPNSVDVSNIDFVVDTFLLDPQMMPVTSQC